MSMSLTELWVILGCGDYRGLTGPAFCLRETSQHAGLAD